MTIGAEIGIINFISPTDGSQT